MSVNEDMSHTQQNGSLADKGETKKRSAGEGPSAEKASVRTAPKAAPGRRSRVARQQELACLEKEQSDKMQAVSKETASIETPKIRKQFEWIDSIDENSSPSALESRHHMDMTDLGFLEEKEGIADLEEGLRMSDLLEEDAQTKLEEDRIRKEERHAAMEAARLAREEQESLESQKDQPQSKADESADAGASRHMTEPAENGESDQAAQTQKTGSSNMASSQFKRWQQRFMRRLVRMLLKIESWIMLVTFGFLVWLLAGILQVGLLNVSLGAWIFGFGLVGLAIAGYGFYQARNKLWKIPAALLCVVMMLVSVGGHGYASNLSEGIASMTNDGQEYLFKSNLYVPSAVPLLDLTKLEGQTVGILETRNKELNKAVLDALKAKSIKVWTQKFSSLQQLYKAVRGQSVRAAILSPADVRMIHEFSGSTQSSAGLTSAYAEEIHSGITPRLSQIDVETDPYTVLVSGSRLAVGETTYNSTINMLVTVNPKTNDVLVTVVPRSMALPGACDQALGCPADQAQDRTGLYSYRSIEALRQSLEAYMGATIDFTIHIDLNEISSLFDVVGGLYENGGHAYTLPAELSEKEKQVMSGPKIRQILGTLSTYSGSDFDQELNQFVMLCDIASARTKLTPLNVRKVFEILDSSISATFTYEQLCALLRQYVILPGPLNVYCTTISGEYQTVYSPLLTESTYMLVPDQASLEQAKSAIQAVLAGNAPDVSGIETGVKTPMDMPEDSQTDSSASMQESSVQDSQAAQDPNADAAADPYGQVPVDPGYVDPYAYDPNAQNPNGYDPNAQTPDTYDPGLYGYDAYGNPIY